MQRACRTPAHADFGIGPQCWQSKSGEQLQNYSCRPSSLQTRLLTGPYSSVMQLQDAQMTYAALANHRQPHLDCLAYLSQLVLHQINVSKLPLLALIYQNNMSWRSYRLFFRDPSMATSKQTYYDLSTMLLKVAAAMPDALVKTKVRRRYETLFSS